MENTTLMIAGEVSDNRINSYYHLQDKSWQRDDVVGGRVCLQVRAANERPATSRRL